ncbi:MAG: hypothetical protein U0792_01845 [Gemmataceae bacterium]
MKATDANITKAASIVAGGSSVAIAAEAVGVNESTIRRWMRDNRWKPAYDAARKAHAVEASTEAVLVLRSLLRSGDEKVRVNAAKTLASMQAAKDQLAARQSAGEAANALAGVELPEDVTAEEVRDAVVLVRASRTWAAEQWQQVALPAMAGFEEWIGRDPQRACELLRDWHRALLGAPHK